MHADYSDIREHFPEPPKWFDECAVPRYCAFTPKRLSNIYACEAALLGIECQACAQRFIVAMSWTKHDKFIGGIPSLADRVTDGTIHYGDPPNVRCCPAGPTMNSVPRRVLEFWRNGPLPGSEWNRVPDLERDLDPEWMHDDVHDS